MPEQAGKSRLTAALLERLAADPHTPSARVPSRARSESTAAAENLGESTSGGCEAPLTMWPPDEQAQ